MKNRLAAPAAMQPNLGIPDAETAWLLSRSALQLGAHETADSMLSLAGDFGLGTGGRIEPSPFAGSKRCGECHRSMYRRQQSDSRHAQTLRFGPELKDVPIPSEPVLDAAVAGIAHSLKRKNGHEIHIESRTEGQVFRAIIDYAVGSGRHGITMLAKDQDGIERGFESLTTGSMEPGGRPKASHTHPKLQETTSVSRSARRR